MPFVTHLDRHWACELLCHRAGRLLQQYTGRHPKVPARPNTISPERCSEVDFWGQPLRPHHTAAKGQTALASGTTAHRLQTVFVSLQSATRSRPRIHRWFLCKCIIQQSPFQLAISYTQVFSDSTAGEDTHLGERRSATHKCLVIPPPAKTAHLGEHSFRVSGPSLWNTLPDNVKDASSVDLFKTTLKTFLFGLSYSWVFRSSFYCQCALASELFAPLKGLRRTINGHCNNNNNNNNNHWRSRHTFHCSESTLLCYWSKGNIVVFAVFLRISLRIQSSLVTMCLAFRVTLGFENTFTSHGVLSCRQFSKFPFLKIFERIHLFISCLDSFLFFMHS